MVVSRHTLAMLHTLQNALHYISTREHDYAVYTIFGITGALFFSSKIATSGDIHWLSQELRAAKTHLGVYCQPSGYQFTRALMVLLMHLLLYVVGVRCY